MAEYGREGCVELSSASIWVVTLCLRLSCTRTWISSEVCDSLACWIIFPLCPKSLIINVISFTKVSYASVYVVGSNWTFSYSESFYSFQKKMLAGCCEIIWEDGLSILSFWKVTRRNLAIMNNESNSTGTVFVHFYNTIIHLGPTWVEMRHIGINITPRASTLSTPHTHLYSTPFGLGSRCDAS